LLSFMYRQHRVMHQTVLWFVRIRHTHTHTSSGGTKGGERNADTQRETTLKVRKGSDMALTRGTNRVHFHSRT
jgi:hypothetical protein